MKKNLVSYLLSILCVSISIFVFYKMYILGISLSLVLLTSIYSFNVILILIIFLQKRNFSAKLSWIMVIILLPIIGHLLFLIFGKKYPNTLQLNEYQKRKTFEYEDLDCNKNDDILKSQSNISARGIYNANFKFYESGNDAFNELFQDILNAKKYIHIHYYIIKPGEIYDKFKDVLIKKSNERVEIKMIIDDFGRWSIPKHEIKELIKNGIKVEIFNKVFFPFINSYNNYRTHRKIVIIDSKIAHIGGLNIADEYASLSPKYGKWIDLQAKIEGQAIKSHELLFIEDWKQITGEFLDPNNYIDVSLVGDDKTVLIEDSPEIKENILHDTLINLIFNAKKEILISTPYFVPTKNIQDALKFTTKKGVKIKIFVPGAHDKKIAWIVSNYFIYKLMKFNIKFYRTKNIFLHSKAGIFDNKISYFGTANIDKRSFYSQLEFINIFYGNATQSLRKIFNNYEKISFEIKNNKKPHLIRNLFYKFFVGIFSPLI